MTGKNTSKTKTKRRTGGKRNKTTKSKIPSYKRLSLRRVRSREGVIRKLKEFLNNRVKSKKARDTREKSKRSKTKRNSKTKYSKTRQRGGNTIIPFVTSSGGDPQGTALKALEIQRVQQQDIINGNHGQHGGSENDTTGPTVPTFGILGGNSSSPNSANNLSQIGNSTHIQASENRQYDNVDARIIPM